jgi:hypothetical protein
MRKILSNAFSDSALRDQEQLIHKYCSFLITRLKDQIDGPNRGNVNIVKWLNFVTFDITGDLSFGESFQALENGQDHYFFATIFGAIKIGATLLLLNSYTISRVILNALSNTCLLWERPRKTWMHIRSIQ